MDKLIYYQMDDGFFDYGSMYSKGGILMGTSLLCVNDSIIIGSGLSMDEYWCSL